jgi:hypothetical protein
MAPRKPAKGVPKVEPAIEQPSELPAISDAAPVFRELLATTRPRLTERAERESGRSSKDGAKSGAGKGAPGKSFSGMNLHGTSASKPKKKKKERKGLTLKGGSTGGPSIYKRDKKKTTKKGPQKRGPKR